MFEPTDKIIVEFTAAEWNELIAAANGVTAQAVIEGLLQMLRQAAVARPLIGRIAEQAAAQERSRSEPQNGAMTAEPTAMVQQLRPRSTALDGSGEHGAA